MYCKKCGLPLDEGTKVCPSCDTPVDEEKIDVTIEEPKYEEGEKTEKNFSEKATDAFNNFNNTEDTTADFDPADIEENKVISLFSYLGFLFLIPMLARKDSKYARFHANQGIVLFIAEILLGIVSGAVSGILSFIPGVGPILARLVTGVVEIFGLVLTIIGVYNAVTGKAKRLPLIGKYDLLK